MGVLEDWETGGGTGGTETLPKPCAGICVSCVCTSFVCTQRLVLSPWRTLCCLVFNLLFISFMYFALLQQDAKITSQNSRAIAADLSNNLSSRYCHGKPAEMFLRHLLPLRILPAWFLFQSYHPSQRYQCLLLPLGAGGRADSKQYVWHMDPYCDC